MISRFYRKKFFRINFAFLFAISLTIFLTTFLTLKRQHETLISNVESQGIALCESLAANSYYGVWTQDTDDLSFYADGILTAKNLLLVFIEDLEDRVLILKKRASAPDADWNSILLHCQKSKSNKTENDFSERNRHWAHFIAPIQSPQKSVLGYAHTLISLEEMEKEFSLSKKIALGVTFVFFLFLLLLSAWFSKRISESVDLLVDATQKISQGNYEIHLPRQVDDEIGNLSLAFSKMADALAEKKSLEKKFYEIEKNAAIGKLAGGMAHEFNNILTSIGTEADGSLIQDQTEGYRSSMHNILEASEIGSSLTWNFLNYANPFKPKKETVSLSVILEKALTLFRQEFKNFGIQTVLCLEASPSCFVDPMQIQQVFINILANARDAMRNGGVLTVVLRQEGDKAIVAVQDTGHGITALDLPKVFEPFFTTKGEKDKSGIAGTGLGLSIVRDIVKNHGGDVALESPEGRGCTVIVTLPISC